MIPRMPMALAYQVMEEPRINGKIDSLGMFKEINSAEYVWNILFRRLSDGKQLSTYVSVPRHEVEYNMYDPEAELMEIIQLAIYEALVNG